MQIPFNSDRAQQRQVVLCWRKTNWSTHPFLYFDDTSMIFTNAQNHLGLQLDNKLSFEEHTTEEIRKAAKHIVLLSKFQPVLPVLPVLAGAYWSFINFSYKIVLIMEMLFMINCQTHNFQIKLSRCNIRWH